MTEPLKPQIIGDNFFLKADGTLGGGETCCQCPAKCDCGTCSLTLLVNGTPITFNIGTCGVDPDDPEAVPRFHDCDNPCVPTCYEMQSNFSYETAYCNSSVGSLGLCGQLPQTVPGGQWVNDGPVGCGGTAFAYVYCSDGKVCARVFFRTTYNEPCVNMIALPGGGTAPGGSASAGAFGPSRYEDFEIEQLPACDASIQMTKVGGGEFPEYWECFNAEATESGCSCETISVELSCNPFI